ncbi:MAG: polyribonucleotide nucleotidyltransferase, partial [Planctomycetota bacterium]
MIKTYKIETGAIQLLFEIGKLATQSASSVVCYSGDSKVLSTLCIGKEVSDFPVGEEFAPLTCEYRERSAAAGKIPGGFFKREGKPSDNEILISRLIDRPIRPLLPKGYFYDTQIISLVLSADKNNPTDILAVNASALAFLLSPIPQRQPLACVRVCKVNKEFCVNPSLDTIKNSSLNIVIAGTKNGIVMLEGDAQDVSESDILSAIEYGYNYILKIIELEEKILSDMKVENTNAIRLIEPDQALFTKIKHQYYNEFRKALEQSKKKERNEKLEQLREQLIKDITVEIPDCEIRVLSLLIQKLEREIFEELVQLNRRFDGRELDELREITCEVGLLPRVHGSALFNRGETQALATVTL